ncbi:MAG: hypothetical protein RI897_149 [Verrucomicrobiota bacterium]
MSDEAAIAHCIEVFNVAGEAFESFAEVDAVDVAEPGGFFCHEAGERFALGGEIAAEGDDMTAEVGYFALQAGEGATDCAVFDVVDSVFRVIDDVIHFSDQGIGEAFDDIAGVVGAGALVEFAGEFRDGEQAAFTGRDDEVLVGPDTDGDHIFGVGAGVKVDAAEDDEEVLVDGGDAWAWFFGEEGFGGDFGDGGVVLYVGAGLIGAVVQVDPECAMVWAPGLDLFPGESFTAAFCIQQDGMDEAGGLRSGLGHGLAGSVSLGGRGCRRCGLGRGWDLHLVEFRFVGVREGKKAVALAWLLATVRRLYTWKTKEDHDERQHCWRRSEWRSPVAFFSVWRSGSGDISERGGYCESGGFGSEALDFPGDANGGGGGGCEDLGVA